MVKPIAKTIHKTKIGTAKLSVSDLHTEMVDVREVVSEIKQEIDNLQREIDNLLDTPPAPTTTEKLLFIVFSIITSAFVAYATVQLSQ